MLLVTQFDSDQGALRATFRQRFAQAMEERGVETVAQARGRLNMNTKPLLALAGAHRTELVMVVSQTGGEMETTASAVPVSEYAAVPIQSTTRHADFVVNLFQVRETQRVWHAQIDTDYESEASIGRRMVEEMVGPVRSRRPDRW